MEDRCVVCGAIVPEGNHICGICKIAVSDPPCIKCIGRQEGCHVYCKKYLTYYKARKRDRLIKNKQKAAKDYTISKSTRKKFSFLRKDEYTK